MSLEQILRLLANEAFLHRTKMVTTFVVISMSVLGIGLVWPKVYVSYTTLLVGEQNIIDPLMQGAAVTTNVRERVRIAQELLFSRRVLDEIVKAGGWLDKDLSAIDQEQIADEIKKRTQISNVGSNLLRVEYRDSSPERAFRVTKAYGEMFISGTVVAKERESREAFEFIDRQVREYHDKLTGVEARIKEFRSTNPDARPASETAVNERINNMLTSVETTTLELREAKIRRESLEKQLSGEAEISVSMSKEGQLRTRIAELQAELENLLLSYQESYPDVVRARQQIEELKTAIVQDRKRREEAKALAKKRGRSYVDEGIANNPLYQQLRSELARTKTTIETLTARLSENRRRLNAEMDRARRIHGGEAAMQELTRDYQVNREIYQDLLRRRENARVSMNLDRSRQDSSVRIQEPAFMPIKPTGLRFLHFAVGGILLGFVVPIGALYGFQQVDPRIRMRDQIGKDLSLPVISVVSHLSTPTEKIDTVRNVRTLLIVMAAVVVVYVIVGSLKLTVLA